MNDIIVGVDESDTARVAAAEAAMLAQQLGRPLHLVMAFPIRNANIPPGVLGCSYGPRKPLGTSP